MLELRDVTHAYGAAPVLRGVSFTLRPGEVHVLAGANGAGKSTLLAILTGALVPQRGTLWIGGKSRRFRDPADARRAGIAAVHQELSLVPTMSVLDNVFLGREPAWIGARSAQRAEARATLGSLGLDVDLDTPIDALPVSQQQLVEIAKALLAAGTGEGRVLVLDEPTSALDEGEAAALAERIRALRTSGCAIGYVTHRLDEVYALADRITVLRDGVVVASAPPAELPRDALVGHMLGAARGAVAARARRSPPGAGPMLSVRALSVAHPTQPGRLEVRGVSLDVARGEIVGLAGVSGSGPSALLHALFGSHPRRAIGTVTVAGAPLPLGDPAGALARGVALVPADRKSLGLIGVRSVAENAALGALRRWSTLGFLARGRERTDVRAVLDSLDVVAPSLDAPVLALSGGNQQKVVLARCLLTQPRVLLLDEPTRGIDVGAKAEIRERLRAVAATGAALLLASAEIDDLLAACDRVLVFHRGALAADLPSAAATRERILRASMGHAEAEPVDA